MTTPALRALSHRPDGLGERLRSLMNAIYLSRVAQCDFAFTWDTALVGDIHHAMPPAEAAFEADFLARHLVSDFDPADYGVLPEKIDGWAALSAAAGPRGWLVRKNNFPKLLATRLRLPPGAYGEIFAALPFAPGPAAAIAAARDLPLPDEVAALHLRAGDIIYGQYRFTAGNADKVVCVPVAERLIADLNAAGTTVLLFNQDSRVAARFEDREGVIPVTGLAARFDDPTEQALFEITLMARANRLIAGSSGFARLAGELSERRPESVDAIVPAEAQLEAIEAHLSDPDARAALPALQNAFAAWSGYLKAAALGQTDRARALLVTAIDLDPVNGLYRLKLAIDDLEAGSAEAEASIAAVRAEAWETAQTALTARSMGGLLHMRREHRLLGAAARRGSPGAAELLAALPSEA